MRPIIRSIFATLSAGAALAACAGDSTGPGASGRMPMSVSFTTAKASGTAASLSDLGGSTRSITTTSGTDVLVITKAQLVLARIELQRVGGTCVSTAAAGDDERGDDNCAELELAPSVVDLPVSGTIATALNVTVPAGTYSAMEAKIRPVEANKGSARAGSAAFLAAHPELAGASVRVEGTFNGKAFTYMGAPRAELESVFNPPLAVTDKGANITVQVDLAAWFKTSAGALINPETANAGGTSANLVAENIRRSFKAFHDDDRNGRDDDEQGGGNR